MEQLIGLIIIYLIFSFFSAIMRKLREVAQPKRPPMKPRPPGPLPPAEARPGEVQPASAPAEPEIPPFLRELLGLDKEPPPPPRPQPVPAPYEEVSYEDAPYEDTPARPDLSAEAQAWEARRPIERMEVPQTGKQRIGTKAITLSSLPTGKKAAPARPGNLITSREDLRKAILLKEILDLPVSMRKDRFPF